jgi:cyclophilin family peptidyl-prolyl cis-trans isomerase
MNFSKAFKTALILGVTISTVAGAAPEAPTGLKVTPLGVNAFLMEWEDNSDNEKGWEIRVSLGTVANPARFQMLATPDITSYVVQTNDLPDRVLSFQLAAYNGEAGLESFSTFTPVVTAKALSRSAFDAPTNFTAVPLDDGRIRIAWKDRTTSEYGYQVQVKRGANGPWTDLIYTNPGFKFSQIIEGLSPSTEYSFRTRAYKGTPVQYTDFSNIATATTKPFGGPINLVAKAPTEKGVVLSWKDRSSLESGFEVEWRTGKDDFEKLGDVGTNVDRTDPIGGLLSDTRHQFRIRAFRLVDNKRVYTAYSNLAATKTPLLKKPVDFAVASVTDSKVRLTWTDNSERETGYLIQYRLVGSKYFNTLTTTAADSKEFEISGLAPNTAYEFRVGATDSSTPSLTPIVKATTKHGVFGNMNPPLFLQQKFLYQIQFTDASLIQSVTVTGLPPGLVFNAGPRTITGTVTSGTSFTATITVKLSNGETSVKSLVLAPGSGAPIATEGFAPVSISPAKTLKVPLAGKFADPDTQSAARVFTTLGNFDIILFPDATPLTTNNFLDYVDAGRYDDVFFHRAAKDFVVQGGGFRHTTAAGFSKVPTYPAVPNEPGLGNVRGTVAMAKLGGQPDSATSEFFVNLNDLNGFDPVNPNAPNLDTQNEGFTVFGRVANPGMVVIDAINNLARKDYTVQIGSGSRLLEDLPINANPAPATIDPSKLVKIRTVDIAPILTYKVQSQNTNVVRVNLNAAGNAMVIKGVAKGTTTITVTAIDLDGQGVAQSIPVTVP